MVEQLSDAALFFDPKNHNSLANILMEMLEDEKIELLVTSRHRTSQKFLEAKVDELVPLGNEQAN